MRLIVLLGLAACQENVNEAQEFSLTEETGTLAPTATLEIDAALQPDTEGIAVVRTPGGDTLTFAEGRLVLFGDESAAAELESLAQVTREHTPEILPGTYTFTLTPEETSSAEWSDSVEALEFPAGSYRVSSALAAATLAGTAQALAAGLAAGLDLQVIPHAFADNESLEAPTGGMLAWGYDADAATWPYMSAGSALGYGIVDAWHLLEQYQPLEPSITVWVLDTGFYTNTDLPGLTHQLGWLGATQLNKATPESGFHGGISSMTAAAVPDNNNGVAGPAGPIATVHAVSLPFGQNGYTSAVCVGLDSARLDGARVLNMSFGGKTPKPYDILDHAYYDCLTRAAADGVLLFAAAGNGLNNSGNGVDVDANESEDCESDEAGSCGYHWLPCEHPDVQCVGGLPRDNSSSPDPDSNYGDDVTFWGPYDVWAVKSPGEAPRRASGTSYASPFVAGVAALVLAADPSLSAGELVDLLTRTGEPGPSGVLPRPVAALEELLADREPLAETCDDGIDNDADDLIDCDDDECATCTGASGYPLVRIPAGTFTMGSPEGEVGRQDDEAQVEITLTRDFWIGAYELTRAQLSELLEWCRYGCEGDDANLPAGVNWHEAAAMANAMSALEGLESCYDCSGEGSAVECELLGNFSHPADCTGYRLPTEAEWEYAARAGSTASFHNGANLLTTDYSCIHGEPEVVLDDGQLLNDIAVVCEWGEVGTRAPNDWGLYDIHGNGWEWVGDWWRNGDRLEESVDPYQSAHNAYQYYKLYRSGASGNHATNIRSSRREHQSMGLYNPHMTARLVRTAN